MTQLTKDYFDQALRRLAPAGKLDDLTEEVRKSASATASRFDGLDAHLGVIDKQLVTINERLDQHDAKLDAILTAVATRQEMRNLVHELNARGIELDETKIFMGGG